MVKQINCPTWKFILDVLVYGYKSNYLLAMSYALDKDRAVRMFQHALEYSAISQGDCVAFVAQLEKRV